EKHFAQAAQLLIQPVGFLVRSLRQRGCQAIVETDTTTPDAVRSGKHIQAKSLLRKNRESGGGYLVPRKGRAGQWINRHAGSVWGGNTVATGLSGESQS